VRPLLRSRPERRDREGMEEGRGKVTEGMGGTGHGMGGGRKGTEEGEGKGGEGLQPPNLNFWRRHCMKDVRAPASHLIWTPHFVNPGSAPELVLN